MKASLLTIFFLILTLTGFAQVKDCYPNCSVTFDMIERERIPSITSVEAIGTQCRVDADKKLKEYRDADIADAALLRNQYCAALSGWEQTGDCEHGGPPPCCTAPAGQVPWANVGEAKAIAALMAKWHQEQNKRRVEIENNLKDCLAGLKREGLGKFNDTYAQASTCLKSINDNKIVADYNKGLIYNYTTQLNNIYQQMQTLAAKPTPDPNAVWNVTTEMGKLQAEICNKANAINNPIKADHTQGMAGGVRAEVIQPKVESQALTNGSSPQTQQKAAYQQTADTYLNAANNTNNNDIQKALDLNLAKINATASGNKAQVAQIQQAQNQLQQEQNQQMTDNITSTVTSLVGLFSGSNHYEKEKPVEPNPNDYGYRYYLVGNYKQAMKWYRKAADAGDNGAMLDIGLMYENGKGFTKDITQAIVWYKMAAEKGNGSAMLKLGNIYKFGTGVSADKVQAFFWYQKSANAGIVEGMFDVGYCYAKGLGVQQNSLQAIEWYSQAAKRGDDEAMNSIGIIYDEGRGNVPKDYFKAKEWFIKATQDDDESMAMYNLGALHAQGHGVPIDNATAFKWFKKSAELSNAGAMFTLGDWYETGFYVTKNMDKAKEYYQQAALKGNEQAKSALKRLGIIN